MRYPIYFFLLLSGFFYLAGKETDDNLGKTAVDSGATTLPYARKIAGKSIVDGNSEKSSGTAKTVVDPITIVRSKPVMVAAAKINEAQVDKPSLGVTRSASLSGADKKSDPVVQAIEVNSQAKRSKDSFKQAALKSGENVTATGWETSLKLSKQDTALGAAVGTYMADEKSADKRSFDSQPKNSLRNAGKKKLDWTVFGNSRKTVSAVVPKRVRSRDELDAEGLNANDRVSKKRQARTNRARSKASRKKQRASQRRAARKARKSRRITRKRKSRRYARLHRKNRNIRRIARRRVARKSRKRRYASNRRPRKRFGFGTVGGVTSLFAGN